MTSLIVGLMVILAAILAFNDRAQFAGWFLFCAIMIALFS